MRFKAWSVCYRLGDIIYHRKLQLGLVLCDSVPISRRNHWTWRYPGLASIGYSHLTWDEVRRTFFIEPQVKNAKKGEYLRKKTYRIETLKLPMWSWKSAAAILVALNLGGPPRLSIAPNTSGSGHTPSYVQRALPVFAEGFHYRAKTYLMSCTWCYL